MARTRITPAYRFHKRTGKGIVTYYDANGQRRSTLLPGKFNSPPSMEAYEQILEILKAKGEPRSQRVNHSLTIISVSELIEQYWRHVEVYYRRVDGTPTKEVSSMRYALRPLNYLLGDSLAKDLGPTALKDVRELMIDGYDHPDFGHQSPLCRTQINARIKRIRRMYKWAVENELVEGEVLLKLQAVAPLKRGRSAAKESPGVKPVARVVVEETLPLLRPTMRDMVVLQLQTGMRPGELVTMRACDIDMSGSVWLYRPPQHKTLHHGHERAIAIGPGGQAVIKRHLARTLDAPLFSPARLMEERAAAMRLKRKTPVQPSQINRRKRNPRKRRGNQYTVQSYGKGIAEAIKRHNKNKPENEKLPHWHPNQLRHLRALELKRQFGLDVARAILGHKQPCITEMYAGADEATAVEVMGKVG